MNFTLTDLFSPAQINHYTGMAYVLVGIVFVIIGGISRCFTGSWSLDRLRLGSWLPGIGSILQIGLFIYNLIVISSINAANPASVAQISAGQAVIGNEIPLLLALCYTVVLQLKDLFPDVKRGASKLSALADTPPPKEPSA